METVLADGNYDQVPFSKIVNILKQECYLSPFAVRQVATVGPKVAGDLKKRYTAGESIRSLAASTGRSYGFIHRILSESGVSLRGRGGATRGRAKAKA